MRIALIFTFLLTSMIAFAAEKTTEVFTLDHQMSAHCEKKIKENLRFEKGISKIDVSLKDNTITITYDKDKTDTEKIIQGFKKIGFTAFIYGSQSESANKCAKGESSCHKAENTCNKTEGNCHKTEGSCHKAEGKCHKAENSCHKAESVPHGEEKKSCSHCSE